MSGTSPTPRPPTIADAIVAVLVLVTGGLSLVVMFWGMLWPRPTMPVFLGFWLGVCMIYLAALFLVALTFWQRDRRVELPRSKWLYRLTLAMFAPFLAAFEWLLANAKGLLGVPQSNWRAWLALALLALLFGMGDSLRRRLPICPFSRVVATVKAEFGRVGNSSAGIGWPHGDKPSIESRTLRVRT